MGISGFRSKQSQLLYFPNSIFDDACGMVRAFWRTRVPPFPGPGAKFVGPFRRQGPGSRRCNVSFEPSYPHSLVAKGALSAFIDPGGKIDAFGFYDSAREQLCGVPIACPYLIL